MTPTIYGVRRPCLHQIIDTLCHECLLESEREKVRVLREALEMVRHDLLGIAPPGSRTIRMISEALATTEDV